MNPEDRKEAETYGTKTSCENARSQLTVVASRRILEELQAACNTFGSHELEEAYWILIPGTLDDDATWIEAMGGKDNFFSQYGSPFEVGYTLGQDEEYELVTEMRRASWILHVHNHPLLTLMEGLCYPSDKDLGSALYWKSIWPELAGKMMFFVIQSNVAVEYACESGRVKRWI